MGRTIVSIDEIGRGQSGYEVMCFDQESSIPLETVRTEAFFIDKHYVLTENGQRNDGGLWNKVYGVAHNLQQVDLKLIARTKQVVDEMGAKYTNCSEHQVLELVDNTTLKKFSKSA